MTSLQLTGQETLLALAILFFILFAAAFIIKLYFNSVSSQKLYLKHQNDTLIDAFENRTKYDEVNVFGWSKPFFLIGLTTSITISLLAFSWTTSARSLEYTVTGDILPELIEVDIPRSQHEKQLPPPPPEVKIEEVITETPIEDKVEFVEDIIQKEDAIESVEATDVVDADAAINEAKKAVQVMVETPPEEEEIKIFSEHMPRFPGCEDIVGSKKEKEACSKKKLLEYINQKLKYPKFAVDNRIEGMAIVQFVVEKDGSISDIEIKRDLEGGCGKAAKNAIASMNDMGEKWIPGKHRGQTVKVRYTLPVKFKLR